MAFRTRMKKVTYSLPEEIVEAVRETVASGAYGSQNEMVTAALVQQLDSVREEHLFREFAKAAKDPRFLRDNEQAMLDFQFADAETARMVPG
jgi:Arc/MetJ-type ribon-helix-helix transcriptional regulator